MKSKIQEIYRIEIHENWGEMERKERKRKERTDPYRGITPFSSPFCLPSLNLIPYLESIS
jgi:NurA-like 5'-3' nuclease